MANPAYTYRVKQILAATLIYELLFWIIGLGVLYLFGYSGSGGGQTQVDFRFPDKLNLLWWLFPLLAGFAWLLISRNKALQQVGSARVLPYILPGVSSWKVFLSFFLLRNAFVFTVIAMAQPAFGTKQVRVSRENLELVLAIDLSKSMNAKDQGYDYPRIEIMKHGLEQLVNRLHGERVGIVIFAANAYVQLPLTSDYAAAKMFISELSTDEISDQGTNVADALSLSLSLFTTDESAKAILLVSDGEAHDGETASVSEALKEKKVMLGAIGIGTEAGAYIPNDPNKPELGYKTNDLGQRISSRLNPTLLKQLASASGGAYFQARTDFPDFASFAEQLNTSRRETFSTMRMRVKENWYQLPLSLALLCWFAFLLQTVFFRPMSKEH